MSDYPTQAEIERLLGFVGTPHEFVTYVNSIWHWDMISIQTGDDGYSETHPYLEVRMVTGGWSGNEEIIGTIEKTMFGFAFWWSSNRGGLHIYRVPEAQWDEPWESLGLLEATASSQKDL